MSERVIHCLELIKVEKVEREQPTPAGVSEGLFQLLAEQRAIGQVGQCVMMGKMFDRAGEPASVDHILLEDFDRIGHGSNFVTPLPVRDLDFDGTPCERRHGSREANGRPRDRSRDQQGSRNGNGDAHRHEHQEGYAHPRQAAEKVGGGLVPLCLRTRRCLGQHVPKLRKRILHVAHHHQAVGGIVPGELDHLACRPIVGREHLRDGFGPLACCNKIQLRRHCIEPRRQPRRRCLDFWMVGLIGRGRGEMVEFRLEVGDRFSGNHRLTQSFERNAVQVGDIGLLVRQIDERGADHGEHGQKDYCGRDKAFRPERQVLDRQHKDGAPDPAGSHETARAICSSRHHTPHRWYG